MGAAAPVGDDQLGAYVAAAAAAAVDGDDDDGLGWIAVIGELADGVIGGRAVTRQRRQWLASCVSSAWCCSLARRHVAESDVMYCWTD